MFLLTIFFITLIIIIYYVYNINKRPKDIGGIPSVSGFPYAWAVLSKKSHDEVQDTLYKSSKGHEIFYSTIVGQMDYLTITSPEYAKDLLKESENSVLKFDYKTMNELYGFYGNGLTFASGETWRNHRKLANPAFNKSLTPEITGETAIEFFNFMKQNLDRPVDVFEIMQRVTIEVLGKLAFGYKFGCLESEETPHIISVYKFIIETVESVNRTFFPMINKLPTAHNRKFFKAMKEFDGFIYDIIENKRKEINNNNMKNPYSGNIDLLTSMLEFSEKEGIQTNSKQLRDDMVTFFVGGHDTTSMALSTAFYFLARYPEMQEKARAEAISILGNEPVIPTMDQLKEMKYINAIIKESLRVYPPAAGISIRELSKPTKVGPHIIPENTLCIINIWQIHYNTKYWENPKQFNPERFLNNEKRHPYAWTPFSYGLRNCVGQNFTLMEQRVVLSMMLLKYSWTLPEDSINKDKLILEPRFLLKPIDLKLIFSERS